MQCYMAQAGNNVVYSVYSTIIFAASCSLVDHIDYLLILVALIELFLNLLDVL